MKSFILLIHLFTYYHLFTEIFSLEDFNISPATSNSVIINGFDDANSSNEIDLFFFTGSVPAANSVTCNVYERDETQCLLKYPITNGILIKQLIVNGTNIELPIDIHLSELNPATGYTFDSGTMVGIFNFCGRCITTHNDINIGYAEILVRVSVNQVGTIPTISIDGVTESSPDLRNDLSASLEFDVQAYRCTETNRTSDTEAPSNYPQGSYLEFCVKIAAEGITCAWVENAYITSDAVGASTMNAIVDGSITMNAITTGNDRIAYEQSPPVDGICYVKTQFPSNIVPKIGTATMTIDGSVVLEVRQDDALDGRRLLRIPFSNIEINHEQTYEERKLRKDQFSTDFGFNAVIVGPDVLVSSAQTIKAATYILLITGTYFISL